MFGAHSCVLCHCHTRNMTFNPWSKRRVCCSQACGTWWLFPSDNGEKGVSCPCRGLPSILPSEQPAGRIQDRNQTPCSQPNRPLILTNPAHQTAPSSPNLRPFPPLQKAQPTGPRRAARSSPLQVDPNWCPKAARGGRGSFGASAWPKKFELQSQRGERVLFGVERGKGMKTGEWRGL